MMQLVIWLLLVGLIDIAIDKLLVLMLTLLRANRSAVAAAVAGDFDTGAVDADDDDVG